MQITIHKEISKNKKLLIFDIKKVMLAVGLGGGYLLLMQSLLKMPMNFINILVAIILALSVLLSYQGMPIYMLVIKLAGMKIKGEKVYLPLEEEIEYDDVFINQTLQIGLPTLQYTYVNGQLQVMPYVIDIYSNVKNEMYYKGQFLGSYDVTNCLATYNNGQGIGFYLTNIPGFLTSCKIIVPDEEVSEKQFNRILEEKQEALNEEVE